MLATTQRVTDSISNPWGTPGYGMSHCTSHGDVCYVKYNASPYVLSSNTPGASGGPVLFSSGILSKLEGYESTPGDHCPNGNRPEINAGSVTFSSLTFLIEMAGSTSYPHFVNNVRVNGNSVTYAGGIKGNGSTQTFVHRAQIANAYNYGMNALFATECHITGTTGYGVVESSAAHCWADNNTQYGFTGTGKLFLPVYVVKQQPWFLRLQLSIRRMWNLQQQQQWVWPISRQHVR